MEKYKDVTVLVKNSFFAISIFKGGKNYIAKEERSKYLYKRVLNLGLFYIAYSAKCSAYRFTIDFGSKLGILRFIWR